MGATREMVRYFRERRDRWLRAAAIAESTGRQDTARKWLSYAVDYETDANAEERALTGRTS